MAVAATDLSPRIGARVDMDVDTLLSGSLRDELRNLLHERGVIVFGHMNLTDEQHVRLGETLGTVGPEYANLAMLDLLMSRPIYEKTAFVWHIDDITEDVPLFGSIMTSRVVAPSGGQTEFANVAAAFEDLPPSEQDALEKLNVVHSFEASQRTVVGWPDYEELMSWQQFPPKTVPLVWRHASGRKSLILGSTASHVEDMSLEEGRALLCRLTDWATQPHYVYSHDWKVGDLLMWDNTTTLHRAQPYPLGCGRASTRVALAGDEPVPPVPA